MINYHVENIEALLEELKKEALPSWMILQRMNMVNLFILWIRKANKIECLNPGE
jgi:hypothetical protein